LKLALQVVGQLIPGLLDTEPVPVPPRLTVKRSWLMLKVAVTCWLALSVTVQVELVPLQAPDQPANDEFVTGVSVSVTWVPTLKAALHVVGQLIPAGLLDTVPAPVPARVTVSIGAFALNVAVTCSLELSVTVHVVLVPLQPPPDQPSKDELAAGVSVSVTWVPTLKLALHVGAQLIPAGLLETVPTPVPAKRTFKTGGAWALSKVAVTCSLALSFTVQVASVPVQPPAHPTKVEPSAAAAVRVTAVPGPKLALHVCPQLIPDGLLLTLPLPVPLRLTASTGESLKVAVAEEFWLNVILQAPTPLQAPDHPAKKELAAGDAARVTTIPLAKLALHSWPQLMPAGLLLTVPLPPPATWTLSWKEPFEELELPPNPPQPERTRDIQIKPQIRECRIIDIGLDIGWRALALY
jgi:hypothetical protein